MGLLPALKPLFHSGLFLLLDFSCTGLFPTRFQWPGKYFYQYTPAPKDSVCTQLKLIVHKQQSIGIKVSTYHFLVPLLFILWGDNIGFSLALSVLYKDKRGARRNLPSLPSLCSGVYNRAAKAEEQALVSVHAQPGWQSSFSLTCLIPQVCGGLLCRNLSFSGARKYACSMLFDSLLTSLSPGGKQLLTLSALTCSEYAPPRNTARNNNVISLYFSAVNPENETWIILFCLLWQKCSPCFPAECPVCAELPHSFLGRAGEVGVW